MAKTSLKRIRTFIEMYNKQDEIQVEKISGFVNSKYMVTHILNDEDRNEYLCKQIYDAGECVSSIIFNVPVNGEEVVVDELPVTGVDLHGFTGQGCPDYPLD